MTYHSYLIITMICLFSVDASATGSNPNANSVIAEALTKIRKYPAYNLNRTLEAKLAPGSSGAITPVRITEKSTQLVVHTGSITRAHEATTFRESVSTFLFFSSSNNENRMTIWDGNWIYCWGNSGTGTKMVDVDINRGATIVENLYAALLQDATLHLIKEELVDKKNCIVMESSSEVFTPFLYIPGTASIFIDKKTGFPVKITIHNEKSKAIINYKNIEINPRYSKDIFNPPKNIIFKQVKGQEDIEKTNKS